ncbi:hypothetical protein ACP70R_027194 [Stipagrostis hirtigluma subsp. patula]
MADNGGGHAAGMAANGAAENGGDPDNAPAAAAANGGNPAVVPAAAAPNGGNDAPAHAVAAVHGAAMGYGGAVAPALQLIPEAALYQVLLRMPAAMVARFRASSRRWRHLTSTENFRVAHYLSRSGCPMPLFFYRLDHQAAPPDDDRVRIHLHAVDTSRRESFELMRFARLDLGIPIANPHVFQVVGSCDGILLLSYNDRLYACNPCTRRWARLPALHHLGDIVAFYPTGELDDREYRVLYHTGGHDADCSYWILSFPGNAARDIGRPADNLALDAVLARGIYRSFEMPAVLVRECLHWKHRFNSRLLVFDPADELFRWMRPPRVFDDDRWVQVEGDQLLEINGTLAMIVTDPLSVAVWVLQDYEREIWVFEYRIELPVAAIDDNRGYDYESELSAIVFVVSQDQERNVLVQCTHALLRSDAIGTLLQTYQLAGHSTILSAYMLQENLLLHAFLPLGPGDAGDGDPPFFRAPVL